MSLNKNTTFVASLKNQCGLVQYFKKGGVLNVLNFASNEWFYKCNMDINKLVCYEHCYMSFGSAFTVNCARCYFAWKIKWKLIKIFFLHTIFEHWVNMKLTVVYSICSVTWWWNESQHEQWLICLQNVVNSVTNLKQIL